MICVISYDQDHAYVLALARELRVRARAQFRVLARRAKTLLYVPQKICVHSVNGYRDTIAEAGGRKIHDREVVVLYYLDCRAVWRF